MLEGSRSRTQLIFSITTICLVALSGSPRSQSFGHDPSSVNTKALDQRRVLLSVVERNDEVLAKRVEALRELEEYGDRSVVPSLVQAMMKRDQHPLIVFEIVHALAGRLADPRAIPALSVVGRSHPLTWYGQFNSLIEAALRKCRRNDFERKYERYPGPFDN